MKSFSIQTDSSRLLVDTLLAEATTGRSVGLLLLAGDACKKAPELARALVESAPRSRWLIVCAAGVLSEKGELEGVSGAVGMRLPSSAQFVLGDASNPSFGQSLTSKLNDLPGSSACLFVSTPFGDDGWLGELRGHLRPGHHVFGGGSLPQVPLIGVESGEVTGGSMAALLLPGSTVSRLCSSSACRLLSPVGRVTKAAGPTILEIDGALALERLAESTADLEEQALVLLARAGDHRPLAPSGRTLALVPIQGIDPSRGSIIASEELPEGTPLAFAVRDAHAARSDLEAQLRTLKSQGAGTAPGFGLYVSCAGRGRALYKSPDVDTRLIATHFPNMPFVGMHSTFEVAPLQGRLTPQVYAGVLGVFSLPS